MLTLNFGMSNGGEVRVTSYTGTGVRELGCFSAGIHQGKSGVCLYDNEALAQFWDVERKELNGLSLRELIKRHRVVVSTSWGADLVALKRGDQGRLVPVAAVNYPTTNGTKPLPAEAGRFEGD